MAFSLVLHGTVPKDEICGVIVGHSKSFLDGLEAGNMLTGCYQYGISLAMSIHRYIMVTDPWTHLSFGGIFSSEHHRILELRQSTMRLRLRRRLRSGDGM